MALLVMAALIIGSTSMVFAADKVDDSVKNTLVNTAEGLTDTIIGLADADIENYLKKNKMKLRDENAVLADYSNLDEGRFSVKLQIKEKDNYIVDMTLVVPDERQAIMLCDNWKKKSSEIYRHLMKELM